MRSIDIPKTPGVYKLFFHSPEVFYIGGTINLRRRYAGHLNDFRHGTHGNSHLQHACDKYGIDALHFEIIEQIERKEDVHIREQYYLDTLKPYYNISPMAQSNLGIKRTPETIAKLVATHKGKPSPFKGIPHTPERVAARGAKLKGKPAWNKGKPWSEATKQRQSKARKGKPNPHKGNTAARKGKSLRPEVHEQMVAKYRATWEAKGPEARVQAVEKRRATIAAKKAARLTSNL